MQIVSDVSEDVPQLKNHIRGVFEFQKQQIR